MNEDGYITYKEARNLKLERDVLEKLFFEKQFDCDMAGREYYYQKKHRLLDSIREGSDENDKDNNKKAQRELLKLCGQFGHDAPCPKTEEEKVVCHCCGQEFNYSELIESYYRKTRFSRMILFDYIKNQPFFEKSQLRYSSFDEEELIKED